jgi:hypothetical protein
MQLSYLPCALGSTSLSRPPNQISTRCPRRQPSFEGRYDGPVSPPPLFRHCAISVPAINSIAAQIHLLWNTLIITPAVLEGGIDLAQLCLVSTPSQIDFPRDCRGLTGLASALHLASSVNPSRGVCRADMPKTPLRNSLRRYFLPGCQSLPSASNRIHHAESLLSTHMYGSSSDDRLWDHGRQGGFESTPSLGRD